MSSEVWYSGNSRYLVLKIEAIGRSIPGELYCLSSEPLFKNENFLYLMLSCLKASSAALSEIVDPYLVGINE